MSLLENTGHSYSGIADIVNNESEKTEQLLKEICSVYYESVIEQEELEKQLEKVKNTRGVMVSDFVYFMKALGTKEVNFILGDYVIILELKSYEDHKINISKYKLTDLKKSKIDL